MERDNFELVLITSEFIYYADVEESDENSNTKMYSAETKELISDNYFAMDSLMQDLEKIYKGSEKPVFISDYMKENMQLIAESGYFD